MLFINEQHKFKNEQLKYMVVNRYEVVKPLLTECVKATK